MAGDTTPDINLSELAYQKLAKMILLRQLPGGTSVIEGRLAEELEISRTPMREALVRLAAEGLLVREGTRSFTVRKVTATEFFQCMKLREMLECEAIGLAVGRIEPARLAALGAQIERLATAAEQAADHWKADDQLHLMFADASGNEMLAKHIRQVRINTRLFEISSPIRRVKADGEEHLAILAAFASGDAKVARRSMLRHLRNLQSEVMAILRGWDVP
ncbi:MAG TPA: GntR family transcriptional regulator [Stellaceae bacterium]|nr:GntR family transcriptional regulator [Stellaceae bacterium]